MIVTQALIDRFFNGSCSPTEVATIVNYLSKNKDAFEVFISKAEWDTIDTTDHFNQTIFQELLQKLKQELFKKQAAKVVPFPKKRMLRFVAAASIILVITGTLWMANTTNKGQNLVAITHTNNTILLANEKQTNNWQTRTNTGEKPIMIYLQDGSTVALYANSVIKYQQPFIGNTRELFLSGDAFFEVAKNKLKPFIVTSGNLSTTALGTSFRVTAFKQGLANIKVKLFTGKVVIKSTKKIANWKADIFLLPGEELNYNDHLPKAFVSKFNIKKEAIIKALIEEKEQSSANDLTFNNTSLPEVIKQLSKLYSTTIHYTNTDIQQMNFTGTINKSDDVQIILKVIAQMNGLQVMQTSDGFTVSKLTKQ
ncbi:MAG: FecR family protein [Pedobacter sp.]|nr:FecR family protein [Chitinophagaceae bacterium]